MKKAISSRYMAYGIVATGAIVIAFSFMNDQGTMAVQDTEQASPSELNPQSPLAVQQKTVVAAPFTVAAANTKNGSNIENKTGQGAEVAQQQPLPGSATAFVDAPPTSDQIMTYETVKQEVQRYVLDENFDLNSFMSDPRLSEMHASQSNEMIEKIMNGLNGVQLKQDQR